MRDSRRRCYRMLKTLQHNPRTCPYKYWIGSERVSEACCVFFLIKTGWFCSKCLICTSKTHHRTALLQCFIHRICRDYNWFNPAIRQSSQPELLPRIPRKDIAVWNSHNPVIMQSKYTLCSWCLKLNSSSLTIHSRSDDEQPCPKQGTCESEPLDHECTMCRQMEATLFWKVKSSCTRSWGCSMTEPDPSYYIEQDLYWSGYNQRRKVSVSTALLHLVHCKDIIWYRR